MERTNTSATRLCEGDNRYTKPEPFMLHHIYGDLFRSVLYLPSALFRIKLVPVMLEKCRYNLAMTFTRRFCCI